MWWARKSSTELWCCSWKYSLNSSSLWSASSVYSRRTRASGEAVWSSRYWLILRTCVCEYVCVCDMLHSTTRGTVRVFKIDAAIRNAFPKCICSASPPQTRRLLPQIGRLLPRIGKFFEEVEGFFQRVLGSYTHKFPKRGAASFMYLPRSRLDLPCLHLSQNSGPVTEGLLNRGINFNGSFIPLGRDTNNLYHMTIILKNMWQIRVADIQVEKVKHAYHRSSGTGPADPATAGQMCAVWCLKSQQV